MTKTGYFDYFRINLDSVISSIHAREELSRDVAEVIEETILLIPDYAAHIRRETYSGDVLQRVEERAALIKIFQEDTSHNTHIALALDPSGIFLLEGPFNSPSNYDLQHTANGDAGLLDKNIHPPYRWFNGKISGMDDIIPIAQYLEIERVSSPKANKLLFKEYIQKGTSWITTYPMPTK